MDFNSLFFVEIFLLSALGIYYLVRLISKANKRALDIVLLILSLFFYLWKGGFIYLGIMIGISAINFFVSYFVGKTHNKALLIIGIVFNTLYLFFFKYCNAVFELSGLTYSIVFPLAISFITFHSISYLVDVYKGQIECKIKNIFDYFLYIFLFMKLVEGPISRYNDINERHESIDLFKRGILRFGYGLAKKVIIADTLSALTVTVFSNSGTIGTGLSWIGLLAYTIQIYFDFSGYCDMAIGVGNMFGYEFHENFKYPYTALSITSFWRKWHITLSEWFKEYIYIPLGGNRKGLFRTLVNIFIIFVITGLWHGNQITFLFWGLYYAFFMIIERLFLEKLLNKNIIKPINSIYVLFVVAMGWVMFRAYSLEVTGNMYRNLFTYQANVSEFNFISTFSLKILVALIIGVLFAGPIQLLYNLLPLKIRESKAMIALKYVVCFILIFIASVFMANNTFSPSLYGGF